MQRYCAVALVGERAQRRKSFLRLSQRIDNVISALRLPWSTEQTRGFLELAESVLADQDGQLNASSFDASRYFVRALRTNMFESAHRTGNLSVLYRIDTGFALRALEICHKQQDTSVLSSIAISHVRSALETFGGEACSETADPKIATAILWDFSDLFDRGIVNSTRLDALLPLMQISERAIKVALENERDPHTRVDLTHAFFAIMSRFGAYYHIGGYRIKAEGIIGGAYAIISERDLCCGRLLYEWARILHRRHDFTNSERYLKASMKEYLKYGVDHPQDPARHITGLNLLQVTRWARRQRPFSVNVANCMFLTAKYLSSIAESEARDRRGVVRSRHVADSCQCVLSYLDRCDLPVPM